MTNKSSNQNVTVRRQTSAPGVAFTPKLSSEAPGRGPLVHVVHGSVLTDEELLQLKRLAAQPAPQEEGADEHDKATNASEEEGGSASKSDD